MEDDNEHARAERTGPPPTGAPVSSGPPISRVWWVTGPVLLALVAVIAVLLVRTAPYIVFMPGSATEVPGLISVTAAPGEPDPFLDDVNHDILFLTVSIRYPSGFEALYRLLDDRNDIAPSAPYLGTQSTDENREFNLALMTDSKDRATKVAMERAGYEVPVTPTGAVIIDVGPEYPAASVVRPGDTVIEFEGTDIGTSDALAELIVAHEPGDVVSMVVERLGESEPRTVSAELAESPTDPGRTVLGVTLRDRPNYEFPFEVSINSGDVGGPSAGLAFTLALIDLLTPGELTGDQRVAVTGTIELDGSVGQVGGVPQKTEAAVADGAVLFLVPSAELDLAVEAARGRLEVRAVDTIDEALAALEAHGGDPVEPVGS